MTRYTVEITNLVPEFLHIEVDAESPEQAIEQAQSEASENWEGAELSYEGAGQNIVTGIWEGEAYATRSMPFALSGFDAEADAFEKASVAFIAGELKQQEFEVTLEHFLEALRKRDHAPAHYL